MEVKASPKTLGWSPKALGSNDLVLDRTVMCSLLLETLQVYLCVSFMRSQTPGRTPAFENRGCFLNYAEK